METPSIETITAILRKHRNILCLEQIEQVELALIGQGEANINLLVTVNQSHRFNIRIGLRGAVGQKGDVPGTLRQAQDVPFGVFDRRTSPARRGAAQAQGRRTGAQGDRGVSAPSHQPKRAL